MHRVRRILPLALSAALALPAAGPAAEPAADEAAIVHALNRLGYGPRPGDVDRVRALGLSRWLELQLHPERIPDAGLAARLAALPTTALGPDVLMRDYDVPREVRREIQKMRAELGEGASGREVRKARRALMARYGQELAGTPRQVLDELQEAKLLRAIHGERQLDEVLVDFWMNHFNVFAGKGPDRFLLGQYERETIRPRAWGKFEDLLRATAESPAMLFYLDNWLSVFPDARGGEGAQRPRGLGPRPRRRPERMRAGAEKEAPAPGPRRRGLNENYAREILELHTLGVDGGYTQKDVTEVARCFTGWTIHELREGRPRFAFEARLHDPADKVVLGERIKAGGRDEGDRVIHRLATHPATARFIAGKLARRFVADEPPPALVERAAATFRRSGGDIRAVMTALVSAPEFLAAGTRGAKIKTPLEFVVSAVRASGAAVGDASELARRLAGMGMPLYMQQPPTGYKDTADAWVSTAGLLARLSFALDLAGGRLRGVEVPPARGTAAEIAARLVPAGLSESTRRALAAEDGTPPEPARVAGLLLGSPEFQRR